MIKLPLPKDTHGSSLDSCFSEISASKLPYKFRLNRAKSYLERQSDLYSHRAYALKLYEFEPSQRSKPEALAPHCGDEVTKGDLVKLYKDIFSKEGTKTRAIYNRIKLSSKERCTICLVGTAETLDHYLPKARYPAFSVDPKNLIPACTKCNKGKGASLLKNKEDHALHPYFSSDNFYDDLWLKAEVIEDIPVRIRFFTEPPKNWSPEDVTQLDKHFESFDIADKFSIFISSELITAIESVHLAINMHTREVDSIKDDFMYQANRRPPNSPVAAMFRAFSESTWFCSEPRRYEELGFI